MPSVLTVAEMAELLRAHPETIRRNAVKFGGWKVGSTWRFPVPVARPLTSERAS